MGYAVYEDEIARDYGVTRWAGYGVPAECDHPDCTERINRGMGYRCEFRRRDLLYGTPTDGCGLHFCEKHLYDAEAHKNVEPKPDVIEWVTWMLVDSSWAPWRERNPREVAALQERYNGASAEERVAAAAYIAANSWGDER